MIHDSDSFENLLSVKLGVDPSAIWIHPEPNNGQIVVSGPFPERLFGVDELHPPKAPIRGEQFNYTEPNICLTLLHKSKPPKFLCDRMHNEYNEIKEIVGLLIETEQWEELIVASNRLVELKSQIRSLCKNTIISVRYCSIL